MHHMVFNHTAHTDLATIRRVLNSIFEQVRDGVGQFLMIPPENGQSTSQTQANQVVSGWTKTIDHICNESIQIQPYLLEPLASRCQTAHFELTRNHVQQTLRIRIDICGKLSGICEAEVAITNSFARTLNSEECRTEFVIHHGDKITFDRIETF